MIPHVMAHCWAPTKRPRLLGGANSEMYTGTWAEQMPTQRPLMKRPTISMPMFWDAQTMMEPMTLSMLRLDSGVDVVVCRLMSYQIHAPIMIEVFRPNISERKPEIKAASHDPPAIEAVMPP